MRIPFVFLFLFMSIAPWHNPCFAQSIPILTVKGKQSKLQVSHYKKDDGNDWFHMDRMEPSFPEIQFYDMEQPRTLQTRIESVVHGIELSLPPEFDYYGYEIRRYMAGIGNDAVYGDPKRLAEELANVRRAALVLGKWQEFLNDKITTIEKDIEENNAEPARRLDLKMRKGETYAFMGVCKEWIDTNEAFLEMLVKHRDLYTYETPNFDFTNVEALNRFITLYNARAKSHVQIRDYTPFRMMLY